MQPILTDGAAWYVCWLIIVTAKTAEPIKMPLGLWTLMDPRNQVLVASQIPHVKGQFWGGKGKAHYNVHGSSVMRWAKKQNQSRCCFGYGLGWAQGSIIRWECTLAPPRENELTVHVWRRWGIISNKFDHLLWPPCGKGQAIIFLPCGFFLYLHLSFFLT